MIYRLSVANAIGAFYQPQMVISESNIRTDSYDDAKSESSHHCPKSRQGAVAIDVDIKRIGTAHTTVSQQAEQVTTRYSRCNDVENEEWTRPGTPIHPFPEHSK